MPTFPTLTPSSRTFTPGEYPHTPFLTMNGKQARVRHSTVMLSSQLRLSFNALSESDMLSILSHYNAQQGSYLSFDLPTDMWAGVTPSDFRLSGYAWRYTEPPQVEDFGNKRHNISLVLESVPGEGASASGFFRTLRISLSVSPPIVETTAPPFEGTITASLFTDIPQVGVTTPPFEGTITASLFTDTPQIETPPGPGSTSSLDPSYWSEWRWWHYNEDILFPEDAPPPPSSGAETQADFWMEWCEWQYPETVLYGTEASEESDFLSYLYWNLDRPDTNGRT